MLSHGSYQEFLNHVSIPWLIKQKTERKQQNKQRIENQYQYNDIN